MTFRAVKFFSVLIFLSQSSQVLGMCDWVEESNVYNRRTCRSQPYEVNCYATATFDLRECDSRNQYIKIYNNYSFIINVENPNEDPLFEHAELYTRLSLRDGYLVTIPTQVFQMTNLSQIRISANKLRIINMDKFLTLPELKYIDLTNNTLMIIESSENEENVTSNVSQIDLSFNFIEVLPNSFIKSYGKLEHLNMSHNLISHIDRNAFEGVVLLKTLDLSHNKLQEVYNLFAQLPKLVNTNYATPKSLQKLSELILDNNNLAEVNLTTFFETGVTELSIGGNKIPCYILARAKYSKYSDKFNRITAKVLNFEDNNVNGIMCEDVPTEAHPFDNVKLSTSMLMRAIENYNKPVNALSEIVIKKEKKMENFMEFIKETLTNMLHVIKQIEQNRYGSTNPIIEQNHFYATEEPVQEY